MLSFDDATIGHHPLLLNKHRAHEAAVEHFDTHRFVDEHCGRALAGWRDGQRTLCAAVDAGHFPGLRLLIRHVAHRHESDIEVNASQFARCRISRRDDTPGVGDDRGSGGTLSGLYRETLVRRSWSDAR